MRVLLPASLLLLAGCVQLPTLRPEPQAEVPAAWHTPTEAAVAATERDDWWQNFADPQLNALIEQVLRRNGDFAAAALRVRRAQLQAELVDTNRSPAVAVGAAVASARSFDPPATSRASGLSASLSFEVDLWGRLASQRQAAGWAAEASEADCRAFASSLVGTTARLYWRLAYLNQLLAYQLADIAYAAKTLALARSRHQAGAASALNVALAEQFLANQEAALTRSRQQRTEARHALALLLDQPPTAEVVDPPALPGEALPAIAADLPAAVLARRPDLRAAELRLRESLAYVDITRTSFYPAVSLTGSLGTASTALLNLLQNPVATLGAGVALPFVQWNTRQLSIRVSENQYEEAVVGYRTRLYTALAEVENGLAARSQLLAEEASLRQAADQARRGEAIAQSRYKAGYTDLQQWLTAQAALRGAEWSLATNRLSQLSNQTTLYQALGLGSGSGPSTCR